MTNPKVPKKGAVARLRKLYNERREKPLTPAQLKEMKNVFKRTRPIAVATNSIRKPQRAL